MTEDNETCPCYDEHSAPKAQTVASRCVGDDPTCPCQDGDACHYRGDKAWPLPSSYQKQTVASPDLNAKARYYGLCLAGESRGSVVEATLKAAFIDVLQSQADYAATLEARVGEQDKAIESRRLACIARDEMVAKLKSDRDALAVSLRDVGAEVGEMMAELKIRAHSHVKYVQMSANPPNGYTAVLVPDWLVKQWMEKIPFLLSRLSTDTKVENKS